MKSLSGYVESITFRNEENGYTVLTLSYGKKEMKCTGNFGYISEGEYLEIEGEEVFHDIYGEQIKVTSYKVIPATDELSLKKYLGSGAIKGLGAVLANRIVDKFGEDTLRIVEEEPERLAEIRGITIRKAMDICEQVEEKKDMRDVMIFLQGYGISPTLSNKIYTMYGQKVYDIIKTNPYKLADDLSGIGFKTADEIARRAGVEVNASIRIKSGMCYALSDASLSGHTYLPKEKLVEKTINLLGLRDQYLNADGTYNMDLLDNCFTELVLEKKLILKNIEEKDAVFLSTYYYTELNIARMLLELNISTPEDDYIMGVKLDTIEKLSEVELDDLQRKAVIETQNNGITIITGGPGTGKTTVLRAIAYVLRKLTAEKITIGYIAPTGKAAKRITESTGEKACTGHTKVGLGCGGQLKKVQERVLFSDESSMADIYLASALSKCIEGDRRLVMVGDVDQLPSVGIGAVLRDMIRSLVIPTTMLTHTFRQDNSSVLFQNIQLVRNGQDNLVKGNDFEPVVLPNGDVSQDCVKRILDSFVKGVKEYGLEQTVVLLPYRRNGVCSNLLNNEIQKIVNPKGKGMKHKDKDGNVRIFRLNDPVMQLENRAEIVNGDVGKVVEVNDMSLKVQYSDCTVFYRYRELDQLTLAYAMSIHKSQGSEYKYVIMALLDSHTAMLQRNLIYTGITRAKTKCTVFYQKKALKKAVTTIAEDSRTTQLTEMLITLHTEYELMNSLVA